MNRFQVLAVERTIVFQSFLISRGSFCSLITHKIVFFLFAFTNTAETFPYRIPEPYRSCKLAEQQHQMLHCFQPQTQPLCECDKDSTGICVQHTNRCTFAVFMVELNVVHDATHYIFLCSFSLSFVHIESFDMYEKQLK